MSIDAYCALSRRLKWTRWPDGPTTAIFMPQLFFLASSSAAAMAFLACSRVTDGPYCGGGGGGDGGAAAGGCCAKAAALSITAATVTNDFSKTLGILFPPEIGIRRVRVRRCDELRDPSADAVPAPAAAILSGDLDPLNTRSKVSLR